MHSSGLACVGLAIRLGLLAYVPTLMPLLIHPPWESPPPPPQRTAVTVFCVPSSAQSAGLHSPGVGWGVKKRSSRRLRVLKISDEAYPFAQWGEFWFALAPFRDDSCFVPPPPLAQARPRSQKSGQNGGSTPTPCLDKAVHARDTCDSQTGNNIVSHD